MATIADLAVRITADMAQFEKATASMAKTLEDTGKRVTAVGAGMTKWVTGPILAVGAGLFALAKSTANAGDEIDKMALRTGFSTTALSELKHAANLSGASIEQVETAAKRMASTIYDAGQGTKAAVDSLAALGLTVADLRKLAPEEQFTRLSTALAEVQDASTRAALAQDIFGRAGTMLLPMLAGGARGLADMRQEAHDLGLVFDTDAAAGAAFFNDELTRLQGAFTGLSREIGTAVIPVITGYLLPAIREHVIPALKSFAEHIVGIITWFVELDPRWRQAITLAIGLAVAIGPVLVVVGKLITLAGSLSTVIGALASPVGIVVLAIGALIAIGVLLYKNWDTIVAWAQTTWTRISGIVRGAIDPILGWINGLISAVQGAMSWVANLIGLNRTATATTPAAPVVSGVGIPQFAAGGIVPGPLGAPRLIMAHAGETVLPTHQRPMRGGDIHVHFEGPVYGLLDFESRVKGIVRDGQRSGAFRGIIPAVE